MLSTLRRRAASVPERTVHDVAADLKANRIQLVDVREPHEWRAGHIAGAVNIPMSQLGTRVREIERDRAVVLVCRSGNRSEHATRALQQAGYSNVANFTGGMLAWTQAGLPVER